MAAVKPISDNDVNLEIVSAIRIKEVKNVTTGNLTRAHVATPLCGICLKFNHSTDRSFFNPRNTEKQTRLKIGVHGFR